MSEVRTDAEAAAGWEEMLFNVLLAAYIAFAVIVILVLLFGESARMRGTIVARAHNFVTGGYWEYL